VAALAVTQARQTVHNNLAPTGAVLHRQYRFAKVNGVLLLSFTILTVLLRTPGMQRIDRFITRRLQRMTRGPVVGILWLLSEPGERPAPVLLTAGVSIAFLLVDLPVEACCTAFTISGGLLNAALKRLVRRQRPAAPIARLLFPRVLGSSFPSGHVMHYTIFYGFLTSVAFSLMHPSRARTATVASLGGLVAAVGPARIMLGAHWASDVTGAYLAGGVWLACINEFYRRWKRLRAERMFSQ